MSPEPQKNEGHSEEILKEIWYRRVDQQEAITGRISETTRLIGFGIVAWVFAVHTSSSEFATSYTSRFGFFVGLAGIFGVIGIICDYLQYVCANQSIERAMEREDKAFAYDENSGWYVARVWLWRLKQWAICIASLTVAVTFGLHVVCRAFGC